ncbi:MAG: carbohydrate-binding protein [Bacteroidales bacterium]|nr:carbohydrate-binding protein [Bacteroidales bacterium]
MKPFKFFLPVLLVAGIALIGPNVNAQFRVVGYFANWNDVVPMAKTLDYSKLTHINYCFVNVTDKNGNMDGMDNKLDTLVKYAHASGVKVLISLGGGAMSDQQINDYFYLIENAERRAQFINKITGYLDSYNLDGFDVDIEGPRINNNYGAFIAQLSDSLKAKGKLMTAALGDWGGDNVPHTVVPLFDFINIMSYDATGSWDQNNVGQHSSFEMAVAGIEKWAARGALKKNLVIGLPFYGYAFNDLKSMGFAQYKDILGRYPYAYNQDTVGSIILYNGIPTIQQKTYYALDSAGGVMIWELAYDTKNEFSLLKAIDDARKNYHTDNLSPVASIVSPSSDTVVTSNELSIKTFVNDNDGHFRKSKILFGNVYLAESADSTAVFNFSNIDAGTYQIVLEAFDHQFRNGCDTVMVTFSPEVDRKPFSSQSISLPGKIEAENFDIGGQDISYKDATEANEGKTYRPGRVDIEPCFDKGSGFHIGWTATGEWTEYTVTVAEEGFFDFDFRAATANTNRTISVKINGENLITNHALPSSGGWQVWKTSTVERVALPQGEHVIRVLMNNGGFNLNYILVRPHAGSAVQYNHDEAVKLFPNPAGKKLFVNINGLTDGILEIYNSNGCLVQSEEYSADANIYCEIDISKLAADVYVLNVKTKNASYSKSFLKN